MKYIIDGHFDLLSDVAVRRKNGEHNVIERLYYPSFKKGNVTGVVASLFVDSQYLPYGGLSIAMEQIAALHCEINESPDLLMLCTSAEDFRKAASTNKVGILLSFEGSEPISSCLMLHTFYAAGVRGLGLTWSRRNMAADGCDFTGTLKKGGLTSFGIDLVKEAESLNMIIDLSHLSDEGVDDILSITSCPVIASHSNARAIAHNNRNLKDSHLKEIAKRGGVVGLNGCSIINADPGSTPDRKQMISHLDHMFSVMGEQHVGLGFDFCDIFLKSSSAGDLSKMPEYPFDILSGGHKDIPGFLQDLKNHNYSDELISLLAGENWLQAFEKILKN